MAKEKIINETTVFSDFIKTIKKISLITSKPIIILPDGVWIIRRNHVESFIQITDPNIRNYYNWAIINPVELLEYVKNYKIKKTGVRIEDLQDVIKVFKDDELVYEIKKLNDSDITVRKAQAMRELKLLPNLIQDFSDSSSWIDVSREIVSKLADGNAISLYPSEDSSPIIISKELFPLINDAKRFAFRNVDFHISGLCTAAFYEQYDNFCVNTILLYIDINK